MAKSPRHWAAVAVIVLWGGALAWLAVRRTSQSDLSLIASQASLRLAPGEAWFRVMAGDVQLGYAGITLDTLANGRYRIREQVSLELPGDTALIRTIRSTEYFLGAGLSVDSLISRYVRPGRRLEFRAADVEGGWDVRTAGDGGTAQGRLEVPTGAQGVTQAPVPLRVVPLRLALVGALATGDPRTLAVAGGWPASAWSIGLATAGDSVAVFADSSDLDPVLDRWIPVTWDTVPTRTLLVESPDGPVRLVLDFRGTVVSIEHPFGVRWLREEFSMARINFRMVLDSLDPEIRAQLPTLRRATQPLARAADVEEGVASSYEVTRRDGGGIHMLLLAHLGSGRQRITRGSLVVFPRGQASGGTRREIPADPLVQVDDSAIVTLANALGPAVAEGNLTRVARTLVARVTLDSSLNAATDAAGALRTGRAQPEGLARLMVAVLRLNGYYARLAIGVRQDGDALLVHAWVEAVQRNYGEWLSIDPATGAELGTEWIRLSHAGSAAPEDLLPLLADVRFTPVSAPATEGATP